MLTKQNNIYVKYEGALDQNIQIFYQLDTLEKNEAIFVVVITGK